MPTPGKDETESDFMGRCVSMMMDEGMDNDQAVAACMNMWRERSDCPIERREAKEVLPGFEYILSDATVDRHGTIIDPNGWDTTTFQKNPIAFFNHNSDWPIGTWEKIRVEGGRLVGKLKLAQEGTSARIDEITKLIRQGILKAVSVGFRILEEPDRSRKVPLYKKVQLLEASVVGVGSNPNALVLARSLGTSAETMKLVFGASAIRTQASASGSSRGASAVTHPYSGTRKMEPISKRIDDAQAKLNLLRDDLTNHLDQAGDEPDEAALIVREDLTAKIATAQRNLDSLQEAEKQLAARTVQVVDMQRDENSGEYRPKPFAQPAEKPPRPGEYFMRSLIATVIARARGWRPGLDSPDAFFRALSERFGQDGKVDERTRAIAEVAARSESEHPLEVFNRVFRKGDMIQRAASAPATTTTSGWASQLVNTGYVDFLDLLLPASVFPGLASRAMRLSFGRNGVISIPTRAPTPTIAGSFVAEGSPIPVRQGAFTSQTFTPKKMGVISAFTREIAEHSTPAIETLIRNAMQEDTSVSLDAILLDTTAASSTRPAGIRNGVSGLTATAGGGFAALVGDIKQLTNALLTGSSGNLRSPVWIMNPAQSLSIGLTQNAGGDFPFATEINQKRFTGYPVVVSGNVTAGMVILLDAADFAVIEAGAPRFDVSDQAVLHFEDTTPVQIGTTGAPNVVAAPARSLWQTDSMAIRMILDVNWGFVRAGTIAFTTAVTW